MQQNLVNYQMQDDESNGIIGQDAGQRRGKSRADQRVARRALREPD